MPATLTIEFEQPAERLSMNGRYHWAVRSRRTQVWRHTASIYAHKRLGAPKAARAQPPSFVRVTFPVADARRRDADNPAPTVKAIVDGLVDAGLWPDDTPQWVETLGSRFAKGAACVVVEIIPRNEPCPRCKGSGKVYKDWIALDTVPGYDPRVPCPTCHGTGITA